MLNYSAAAQYKNEWLNSERVCRGLILEEGTNKIVARGPSKFMNYGQPGAPETTLDTLVRVTTKHDGSLGIFWMYGDDLGIATRGSFTSDQALHASTHIKSDEYSKVREEAQEAVEIGETYVAEIVYPSNRIVLSYGDQDRLFHLGYVSNFSGVIVRRPPSINLS